MAGYYGFMLVVRLSYVHPSVFSFPDGNLGNYQLGNNFIQICHLGGKSRFYRRKFRFTVTRQQLSPF